MAVSCVARLSPVASRRSPVPRTGFDPPGACMKSALILFVLSLAAFAQPSPIVDSTQQLLQQLADAPGPPGFEEPVRKIMVEHFNGLGVKISYDGLGSVIAQQGATGPRVMLDAHMDELGGV